MASLCTSMDMPTEQKADTRNLFIYDLWIDNPNHGMRLNVWLKWMFIVQVKPKKNPQKPNTIQ